MRRRTIPRRDRRLRQRCNRSRTNVGCATPDPDVLLMDEPFASLDALTRDILLVEMQIIWQKTKKTIIFVTHNVAEATVLGTKVAIFSNRPSVIKKEVIIDYPRPRLVEDEKLMKTQREILAELKPEVKKSGDVK